MARERLERTVRLEADIRTQGDQRVEVRGLGSEMYRDAKGAAKHAASQAKEIGLTFLEVIAYVMFAAGALGLVTVLLFLLIKWLF